MITPPRTTWAFIRRLPAFTMSSTFLMSSVPSLCSLSRSRVLWAQKPLLNRLAWICESLTAGTSQTRRIKVTKV